MAESAHRGRRTGARQRHDLRAVDGVIRNRNRTGSGSSCVGVKVTLMVQLSPAINELPQVSVWVKSPLTASGAQGKVALPVLVRVSV